MKWCCSSCNLDKKYLFPIQLPPVKITATEPNLKLISDEQRAMRELTISDRYRVTFSAKFNRCISDKNCFGYFGATLFLRTKENVLQ